MIQKKKIDYKNLPECDLIDDYVLSRLRQGLHTHILVTGLQGRGKSDFGIRMGERLSARINNGIEFGPEDIIDDLLKLLDRIRKIKAPGEIIMIEEVSVLFPSRRHMAEANLIIGRVLDTIRKKQVILISNAPLYNSIDSHMRALAEVLVECQRVIKSANLVRAKAWKLQTNPQTGKTYKHRFRRSGKLVVFHYAKKSNPLIRNKYEHLKDAFIDGLYNKMYLKLEAKIKKENGLIEKKKLTEKQEIVYNLMKEGLNQKEIAEKLKTTPPNISEIKKFIIKKGYDVDFTKENQETRLIKVSSARSNLNTVEITNQQ